MESGATPEASSSIGLTEEDAIGLKTRLFRPRADGGGGQRDYRIPASAASHGKGVENHRRIGLGSGFEIL